MNVKHIVSYGVSSSVSCIHFHQFIPTFVFVGSNEGSLFGFNLPKINKNGEVECAIDSGHIYQAQGPITSIKTSKSKMNPNHFFIVLSDQSGFINILKGNNKKVHSYQPFCSYDSNVLVEKEFDEPIAIWSICTNPFVEIIQGTQYLKNIIIC